MSAQLLVNIKELVNVRSLPKPIYGVDMSVLPTIKNAWLLLEDGIITDYGEMGVLKSALPHLPESIFDCSERLVMPSWCDSHTHLVFSGSREKEFVDKIKGLSYSDIHASGGGILSTVRKVTESTEDELFRLAWNRIQELSLLGTGAVEIKSGYGLSLETELKMLRVIKKLKEKSALQIRSTFLGAHSFPIHLREDHESYIKEITEEMLPAIAEQKLADFIDIFCEKGFFNPDETETILQAGERYGLRSKMHVNQMHSIGGIETGLKMDAISMDHLETLTIEEIRMMKSSNWKGFCTLLPTAAWFLRLPFPPVRNLIESNMAIALASDFNPGSSPSGNMNLVFSLACIQMKMLPEEALNSMTTNGAFAMGVGEICGTICKGLRANLIVTKPIPSLAYLPYAFGSNNIDRVILNGLYVN